MDISSCLSPIDLQELEQVDHSPTTSETEYTCTIFPMEKYEKKIRKTIIHPPYVGVQQKRQRGYYKQLYVKMELEKLKVKTNKVMVNVSTQTEKHVLCRCSENSK